MNNKELGNLGETLALKYLEGLHYVLITSNWRNRFGELDLVMITPKQVLVFVEVKLRTSATKGNGMDAVTNYKQEQIHRLINLFLLKNPKYRNYQLRIDVISIDYDKANNIAKNITHIQGI